MKPQDIVVAIALTSPNIRDHQFATIAHHVGIGASEAHSAVKRLQRAGIVNAEREVIRHAFIELLVHGFKYFFPASPSGLGLGVPTGASAPMLTPLFPPTDDSSKWVWSSPLGKTRGLEIEPLYKTVPGVAQRDAYLYEMLALLDALRAGRAREKKIAEKRIAEVIGGEHA